MKFLLRCVVIIAIISFLLICGSVIAMNQLTTSGSWRYKMTVTVETPEGIKTGSAVREISNSASSIEIFDLPEVTNPAKVIGEAVVVDLGSRGKLFALLKGYKSGWNYADGILYQTFPGPPSSRPKGIKFYSELKNAKATLTPTNYPILVAFTDLNDPRSAKPALEMEVINDPPIELSIKADNFEELFGAGVKLKEISIEMTDEPVTWEIEESLPWLPARKGMRGTFGSPPDDPTKDDTGLFLTGGQFSRGKLWK